MNQSKQSGYEDFNIVDASKPIKKYSSNPLDNLGEFVFEEFEKDRNGRMSPTDGATHCTRMAYYNAFPRTVRYSAATKGYFAVGKAIEDFVVDLLSSNGLFLARNIRAACEDLQLGAEIDILLNIDDRLTVCEVKSKGSSLPSKPDAHQLSQLEYYMAYLVAPGMMFYMSRNISNNLQGDLVYRAIPVPYNLSDLRDRIYLAAFSRYAIDHKLIPNKTIYQEKDCGFCPLKNHCWRGEPVEFVGEVMKWDDLLKAKEQANLFVDEFFKPNNIKARRRAVWESIKDSVKPMSFKKYASLFDAHGC